jgi:CDP-glycerol glycerophosphotransferase
MLSRFRRRRASAPRLSVVVPVYNVEGYLAECLDSILAQTFDDLEILLVDDGSTDGSVAIAERYVGRHRNVRMVQQPNAGLSGARNTGVRNVSGELLAFVDSDDTLLPEAYDLMVGTLDETGSDFVVGSLLQGVPGDAVEPLWLRPAHQERRLGIRVDDHPEVIHNVFAWNKVFRRSFWDREAMSFPEGVRYEDQVAITRAYLLADRFDVLIRPVYLWRVRTDQSSITQRRHELADLQDRVATKLMTTRTVEELASPRVRSQWLRRGLPGDLPLYFREIPGCSDDYWSTLHTGLRQMVDIDAIRDWWIPVPQRLIGWLVAAGRRAEAVEVVEYLRTQTRGLDMDVRGDHVVALLPYADDASSGIPPELYHLAPHEIVFDARLVDVRLEDATITVEGWALIRGVPPGEDLPMSLTAVWRRDDGVEVPATVSAWSSPEIDAWMDREHQRFDRSGFTATVDVIALARAAGQGASTGSQEWSLVLDRRVAGISRAGTLRSRHTPAGADSPLPDRSVSGHRCTMRFDPGRGGLLLSVVP